MLTVEDLRVALDGRPILHGIDFAVDAGVLLGVVGPNGAGKSTLVRAVANLLRPEAGRVRIGGRAVTRIDRRELAQTLAYLPQGRTIHWPLTVERLVALGRLPHLAPFSRIGPADRAAINRAMAQADIIGLGARDAMTLSGGERARALLARALAVEAAILIVDEPLASLDPAHQLQAMQLLRDVARDGRLVIAVLHDLALAMRFCDRLLLLDKGRLAADGSPTDVLSERNLAEVYGIHALHGAHAGERFVLPWNRARS